MKRYQRAQRSQAVRSIPSQGQTRNDGVDSAVSHHNGPLAAVYAYVLQLSSRVYVKPNSVPWETKRQSLRARGHCIFSKIHQEFRYHVGALSGARLNATKAAFSSNSKCRKKKVWTESRCASVAGEARKSLRCTIPLDSARVLLTAPAYPRLRRRSD